MIENPYQRPSRQQIRGNTGGSAKGKSSFLSACSCSKPVIFVLLLALLGVTFFLHENGTGTGSGMIISITGGGALLSSAELAALALTLWV